MCSLKTSLAGKRWSIQFIALAAKGASGEISLNSAITDPGSVGFFGKRLRRCCANRKRCQARQGLVKELSSIEAPSGLFVIANQQSCVRQIPMRRHFQIVGRRFVLVNATSEVKGRAVAGAEETTRPIVR